MAALSLLGGQEGVQVDAELAAEAPDGAGGEVVFWPRLSVAVKFNQKLRFSCRNSIRLYCGFYCLFKPPDHDAA